MIVKKQFIDYLAPSLLGFLFIVSACSKEKVVNVNPVCFETEVLPILVSNCTYSGCHNSSDREDGVELTSYSHVIAHGVVPGDYKASELYQVLIRPGANQMPKKPYSKLSVEQIGTIALWIEQGAQNTTCTTSTDTCGLSNVTYALTVKPILDRACNSCHSGPIPSGNINLSNYNGVKRVADNGSLVGTINHDPRFPRMPDGGSKLPTCDISVIQEWVRLGALNN